MATVITHPRPEVAPDTGAVDPTGQKRWNEEHLIEGLDADITAGVDAGIAAHVAELNPHTQYIDAAELAAGIADHVAELDPHTQYIDATELAAAFVSELAPYAEVDAGKLDRHGFPELPNHDYLCDLTYNETTRTFTLTPTGADFDVWVAGERYTFATSTSTHGDVQGGHFWYVDDTGALTTDVSPWDILTDAPAAYVFWDATNNIGIPFNERHHADRDRYWHHNAHFNVGTTAVSGFGISGYTLSVGSSDAATTYGIDSGVLADEDIRLTTDALPDGGPYWIMERVGASGTWSISRTATVPYLVTGNNLEYNLFTAGSWGRANVTEDYFCNYWVFAVPALPKTKITPSPTTSPHILIVPPQGIHSTLSAAQAESVAGISWGDVPFQEIAPLYQVTMRRNASPPSAYINTARCAVVAVARLIGTKSSISLPAAAATAGAVTTDTANFAGALSAADTTVQAALDTLDDHVHTAASTTVNAAGFTGNLSGTDTDVQTALATLDAMVLGTGPSAWVIKTTTYTAVAGDRILADTSGGGFTITLPASAALGAEIAIADAEGTFDTGNLTVARNGLNLMALAENMTVTRKYASLTLTYKDATYGWRLT